MVSGAQPVAEVTRSNWSLNWSFEAFVLSPEKALMPAPGLVAHFSRSNAKMKLSPL